MLSELNDPGAVRKALAEFNQIGRENFLQKYGFGPSRDYFVQHKNRFYDSKAIVGAAFGYAFPERGPLTFDQFKGGEVSVKKRLEHLGFRIVRAPEITQHYLLKLNRDQVPESIGSHDWETKDFNIGPVCRSHAGHRLNPLPPPMTPGSEVAIWVNGDGNLGGIRATARIAEITHAGLRCRLRDISFCEPVRLAHLSRHQSHLIRDFYEDVNANRPSRVRHLPVARWNALKLLIENRSSNSDRITRVRRVAALLNEQAHNFRVSSLQKIRSCIHRKKLAGSTIFSAKTIMDTYAFHLGGREELQFNIGEEVYGDQERFRWGVAFSFESSRSLPDINILAHKVRFFNDYIALYGDTLSDMRMWYFADNDGPIDIGNPQRIETSLVRNQVFVFLGKHTLNKQIDTQEILTDFDRLLPLYEYVESCAAIIPAPAPFIFRSGHKKKARRANASIAARELEIELRHEAIQEALHDLLRMEHGADVVGTEQICLSGKRIDAVVKRDKAYWLYEIKTPSSPRMCIREAVGQLLEYCLWPGGVQAEKLVVVGEMPLDPDAKTYLVALNGKLSIPIEYRTVQVSEV